MIQRKQTLLLILNDIIFVVLFFVPFMTLADAKGPQYAQEFTLTGHPMALIGEIVIVFLTGLTIVMFKNRKLQMTLCVAGLFLSVVNSALLAYIPTMLNAEPGVHGVYSIGIGMYLSVAHLLIFFVARMFIRRDEDLVNSMDRLR